MGLTQEEALQGEGDNLPNQFHEGEDHITNQLHQGEPSTDINVGDNIEDRHFTRKSKRLKTVPTGLVQDYQCGPHLLSRLRESQRNIFRIDISEVESKYAKLLHKLKGQV